MRARPTFLLMRTLTSPFVLQDLVSTITVLQSDVYHTRDVKDKVSQCVQDTIAATRIVDGFRNPQQNGMNLKHYAYFPIEFVLSSAAVCLLLTLALGFSRG